MTTEITDKAKELAEAAAQQEIAETAERAAEVAAAQVAETIERIENERDDEKWTEIKTTLQEMRAEVSTILARLETVERVASEARDDIRQTREMVEAMEAEPDDTEPVETESQEESPDGNPPQEAETLIIAAEPEPETQQSAPASEEPAPESPRRRGLLFRK